MKVKPSGNCNVLPELYKLIVGSNVSSNHSPITLKRVNNWVYWGDDGVKTTCVEGKEQLSLGSLSLHARQIQQTPNAS